MARELTTWCLVLTSAILAPPAIASCRQPGANTEAQDAAPGPVPANGCAADVEVLSQRAPRPDENIPAGLDRTRTLVLRLKLLQVRDVAGQQENFCVTDAPIDAFADQVLGAVGQQLRLRLELAGNTTVSRWTALPLDQEGLPAER